MFHLKKWQWSLENKNTVLWGRFLWEITGGYEGYISLFLKRAGSFALRSWARGNNYPGELCRFSLGLSQDYRERKCRPQDIYLGYRWGAMPRAPIDLHNVLAEDFCIRQWGCNISALHFNITNYDVYFVNYDISFIGVNIHKVNEFL